MALVYKTINLWAFRDNNVHILCFAGENLGKEIRFKLINADGSVLELNSSDKVNFYWHPEGYNQSHYIEGLIQTNESGIVSIPVTKEICSVSGRISCVLEVNRAGTTTKFGSINIDITDGVGSIDISNLNSAEYDLIMTMQGNIGLLQKKLNDLALNNDPNVEIVEAKGVSSTLKNKIANYDTFAMFPNQAINCIKNSKNFINTDNWESVNTGTLTATGYSLKAVSEDNFGIYGSLEKDLSINYNKTIMVKARVRCISGTSCTVKPCWRKNTNGVLIAPEYIAAGNMDVSTANNSVSWNLPTGKRWRDIWFIAFDGGSNTSINQIGLFITSGTTVEIGHFECYYSQDSGLTNGEIEGLVSDVFQNEVDISNLQTTVNGTKDSAGLKARMTAAEGNITALQATVNGSASTSGTVKNQIATAKAEIIQGNINPLAERVKATENHVSTLQTEVSTLNTYSTQIGEITDVTGGLIAGFVNANTGILGTGGNYQRTDYIPVSSNAVVYYSGRIMGWAGVAGFDKNKKYVAAILKNDDNVAKSYDKHLLNIPDNVKYIIATTLAKSFGLEIITHKKIVDFKIEPDSNIIPNLNHFAVFKSFSAIGDSITEGLYPSTFNEDGSVKKWATNKSFSWVRYLGALTGASNYNYGVSGATAKTWYTNQYGYSMMVNNNKRTQAYIIGLGVNDTISADYPIGSIADVDFNDCLNNAETFIGCYAKIIQSVISLNPTAKIFCLIPPNISASTASKYDALKTLIADEHFVGTVFCVDLSSQDYKGFYQTDAVTKFKFGVHYSAPGYAQLAKILLYALSKTMIDNSQYFNQISEIVYDN